MVSVPLSRAPFEIVGGEVRPGYLDAADHAWLGDLLQEVRGLQEQPLGALAARLAQRAARHVRPARFQLAAEVLRRMCGTVVGAHGFDLERRLQVFELASHLGRVDQALEQVCARYRLTPGQLRVALFADLPEERLLAPTPKDLTVESLTSTCNLVLVQALMRHATAATVTVRQRSRSLVRLARGLGLLCDVRDYMDSSGTVLEIHGPLARVRQTRRYGNALGRLLPLLRWCGDGDGRFQMRARCLIGGQEPWLSVTHLDPLPAAPEPPEFDSHVERRLAQDLARLAPQVEVLREPEPIHIPGRKGGFLFPDFRLRSETGSCLVEVLGFWTPDYLQHKLDRLEQLAGTRRPGTRNEEPWILCVDQKHRHAEDRLPGDAGVVWFERRVDAAEVLQAWTRVK